MKREDLVGLWWVPLLLGLAPIAGLVPGHRDLLDFFLPMRGLTADLIATGTDPWLNLANGCGEAWFANPETAVLYPPAWLHLVLPPTWALSLEIGFHLALLSLGVGLLARELGASRVGRRLAEVAAWSSGPVLFSVGVLNNLETLTWLPWMALAARAGGRTSVVFLGLATALGWLGGEPQVWAAGVVLSIAIARDRIRAFKGVVLGVAVVLVQLVSFAMWVVEGDRGQAATWILRGAVAPSDWGAVLVPGLASGLDRMIYAESLFLGAPLLVCALLGGWRHKWLLGVVAGCAVLATLPEVGAGRFFVVITGGLVRYPSRFALIGLALLLPLLGRGADDWLDGRGRRLAVVVSATTLLICAVGTDPWGWLVAGAPALLMLVAGLMGRWRALRLGSLLAGAAGLVVAGLPLLGLRPIAEVRSAEPTWPEAVGSGRVYAPTPAEDVMRWLASGIDARRLWPVGYLNLEDGLQLARTDAPVMHQRLASHIATTDEGPTRRWWLDTLAAEWIILPEGVGLPESMELVAKRGGMQLMHNSTALPVVGLAGHAPHADQRRQETGKVLDIEVSGSSCTASFVSSGESWLWVSLTPVKGWRWLIDGRPVELEQGPGIVQYLEVAPGNHRLEGRYRPPFHLISSCISGCALLVVLVALAQRRDEVASS